MSLVTGVRIKKNGQVYLHDMNPNVDGIMLGLVRTIPGWWHTKCTAFACGQMFEAKNRVDAVDKLKQHYLRRHIT
jgi:hypothetical protein